MTDKAPAVTPPPIAAFVPTDILEADPAEEELVVEEELATEEELVAEEESVTEWWDALSAKNRSTWIASAVLQHAVLYQPQHQDVEFALPSQGVISTVPEKLPFF